MTQFVLFCLHSYEEVLVESRVFVVTATRITITHTPTHTSVREKQEILQSQLHRLSGLIIFTVSKYRCNTSLKLLRVIHIRYSSGRR